MSYKYLSPYIPDMPILLKTSHRPIDNFEAARFLRVRSTLVIFKPLPNLGTFDCYHMQK